MDRNANEFCSVEGKQHHSHLSCRKRDGIVMVGLLISQIGLDYGKSQIGLDDGDDLNCDMRMVII